MMNIKTKLCVIAIIIFGIIGCVGQQGEIKNTTTIEKPDGTKITSITEAKQPELPADELVYSNSITGEYIGVPAAQSEAEIEDIKQEGKNKRLLYLGAAIIMLVGAVAFALPNYLVSNKDAAIVFIMALVAFGALRYVEASEQYMGYILPICITCSIGWVSWNYISGKKKII